MQVAGMSGRRCLVTGASQGIGRVTAVTLARMGADVSIVVRNKEKGEEVVAEARQAAADAGAKGEVDLFLCDLSSMAAVRGLAAEFKARHDKLHVLVNNAGAMNATRKVTTEGFELTFATNHLAYFLLTELLRDLLVKSAPSRIVSVASEAHRRGHVDFDDLQAERAYSGVAVYSTSKLMNILWTYELARRLEGTGVTANTLHPGVVRTGFGKNDPGFFRWVFKIGGLFFIGPEKGAQTQIHLATAPELAEVTGKYFDRSKEKRSSLASHDQATQRRLWDVSTQLLGL
jgi:NAD(P)-dependent dehydrogenase (short-subunit alcohol dehydrogenase family)